MKILLDDNVPRALRTFFSEHQVSTAREKGWDRLVNGELMKAAAEAGFEVLLTTDANLRYQQNEAVLPLRVIVLLAKNNTLDELSTLVPEVLRVLSSSTAKLVEVGTRRK